MNEQITAYQNCVNTIWQLTCKEEGICEDDIYQTLRHLPKSWINKAITELENDGKIKCIYISIRGRYFKMDLPF